MSYKVAAFSAVLQVLEFVHERISQCESSDRGKAVGSLREQAEFGGIRGSDNLSVLEECSFRLHVAVFSHVNENWEH